MPNPNADRNLLFGILALQMDFITRDQLVEGMGAWVLDKSKALGDVLVDRGDISPKRHDLLDSLVEEHLGQHSNDPEKSLSAVAGKVQIPPALNDALDPELQASIKHLILPDAPAGSVAETVGQSQVGDRVRYFGDYELVDEIGRGGMGVVYRAKQVSLDRTVALKMILAGQLSSENEVARFHTEAEASAKLDHAGIVPIHEIGEHEGQHYFSMGFVEGKSLQSMLKDGPLPARQAATIVRQLAEAVQHAHDRGIIHRDLKPGNVLIDKQGEAKLTDFGLAKRVEGDSELTASGQVLGTPSYMSPEQAQGKVRELGPPTDIYALGAILYAASTGRPPFQSDSVADTLSQVIDSEPVPPRRLNPTCPKDLDTICLKCLRKELHKRYTTASGLADDLHRWLNHEPIKARPVSRSEKAWLWCKRKPAVASMMALMVVLVAVGTFVGYRIDQQRTANDLFGRLLDVETPDVPEIIERLGRYRRWVDDDLRSVAFDDSRTDRERLHARLALLPNDASEVETLRIELLRADEQSFPVIRDALADHKRGLIEPLWTVCNDAAAKPRERFRAACALAAYEPESEKWESLYETVANVLVSQQPANVGSWIDALKPAGAKLSDPLIRCFRDVGRLDIERSNAASALSVYLRDDASKLADLVMDAEGFQFSTMLSPLEKNKNKAISLLTAELSKSHADMKEEDKIVVAKRQANAAVALLRLGEPAQTWEALALTPDTTTRSYLIHRLSPMGADPRALYERLKLEVDASIRRALILSLGEYGEDKLTLGEREPIIPHLLHLYENDPDAGVHGAAEWTLRRWDQQTKAQAIGAKFATGKKKGDRQWFVNKQGQTFAIINGPIEFTMGERTQALHVRIGLSFAIAMKEVTREQFEEFITDHPETMYFADGLRGPDLSGPAGSVSWYQAAAYCNWLSEKEGVARDQWCYEPNEKGKYAEGMKPANDFQHLTGYRLPTEAEWEYACRVYTTTDYYFGQSIELLDNYVWSIRNAHGRTWSCGLLKPNDLGLYDTLGNAWEWTQSKATTFGPVGEKTTLRENSVTITKVQDRQLRVHRGNGVFGLPYAKGSTLRAMNKPSYTGFTVGFRPARTCP